MIDRLRLALSACLYLGSLALLGSEYFAIRAVYRSYGASYPTMFGGSVPATSSHVVALMPWSGVIFLAIVALSLLGLLLVLWRGRSRESRLYWINALASINGYLGGFALVMMVFGFFLLPKLAAGF